MEFYSLNAPLTEVTLKTARSRSIIDISVISSALFEKEATENGGLTLMNFSSTPVRASYLYSGPSLALLPFLQ